MIFLDASAKSVVNLLRDRWKDRRRRPEPPGGNLLPPYHDLVLDCMQISVTRRKKWC
jgi:hypothetical protein